MLTFDNNDEIKVNNATEVQLNKFPPFESAKTATMTVVIKLDGKVELPIAFPLLDIVHINVPENNKQKKKNKIPHCGLPGAILSAKYETTTRGVLKTISDTYFLNAITIDMDTKDKVVCLKLSSKGIHLCGVTSIEMALDVCSLLLQNLHRVDDRLKYLEEHPEVFERIIEWIHQTTKGELVVADTTDENDNLITVTAHLLQEPNEPLNIEESDDIDKYIEICSWLISQSKLFPYYEDFCYHLEWIKSCKSIIERPLKINTLKEIMINVNYSLGFTVNRAALANEIQGVNGFTTTYDNAIKYSVTIKRKYDVSPEQKQRTKKVPSHTFIVYRSGLVTQSGPNRELMKEAYSIFRSTIESIKHKIIEKRPVNIPALEYDSPNKLELLEHKFEMNFDRKLSINDK